MRTRGPRTARGLTLIELTISLLIVAVLFSAAVIGVGAITGSRARGMLGELGGVARSLYDTAGLAGKTCRLVLDLGPPDKPEDASYRAECAEGNVTSGTSDPDKSDSQATEASKLPFPAATDAPTLEDLAAREKNRVEAAAKFSAFTSPEVQPRKLPGVRLSVWTQGAPKPITSGLAYLYFFPQGYTRRTHLIAQQGNNVWTLQIMPLTGKTSVVSGSVEPPK